MKKILGLSTLGVLVLLGCAHSANVRKSEEQCTWGNVGQCISAARAYLEGAGVRRDEALGATYYKKACDQGSEFGCLLFAQLHEWGLGVALQPETAKEIYSTLCDAGHKKGCAEKARVEALETVIAGASIGVKQGLPRTVIESVIEAHKAEVAFCYERSLVDDPSLSGRIELSFTIDATGAVSSTSASNDTMRVLDLQGCVVEQVKKWRFPAPQGGVTVPFAHSFVFEPKQ